MQMAEVNLATRFSDGGEEPTATLPPLEGYEKKELVSLEEAVKPIDIPVYNLGGMVWAAKRNSQKPSDNLTSDESASIRLYTMECSSEDHDSFYKVLNKNLRSEQRKHLKAWFSYLKLLFTALYKLPSVKKRLWRGIRGNVSDQYQKDYIWWGFSSCTTTVQAMETFIGVEGERTLFMIECINGKDIKAYSSYQNENEVLLMPGTYLKVIEKTRPTKNLHIVHLQEENPPHELRKSPFVSAASTDTRAHSKRFETIIDISINEFFLVREWLDPRFLLDAEGQQRIQMIQDLITPAPSQTMNGVDATLLDRITGSMIGLAIGDALGAHVQFRPREYLVANPVGYLKGGGTLGLKSGQVRQSSFMERDHFTTLELFPLVHWQYIHGALLGQFLNCLSSFCTL